MRFLTLLSFIVLLALRAAAFEGMWIPSLIDAFHDEMKALGMKLSKEEIYSVNHASTKDAVVQFGGGCTAEFISDQGLLLTNYHCGLSQVQSHSSVENDYLKNGFWAMNMKAELANAGLTATRVVRIEDVTERIMGAENKMAMVQELEKEYTANTHYKATIRPFDYGRSYYLLVTEVFQDVRLVAAPPGSIGKYGGDTDNWVWPRHTGDYCVFRVYVGPDGKPAPYAEDNVPYVPIHHFPVSLLPRTQGQFTMVYGFPGSTEQHLSSERVKFLVEEERPLRISMRDASLDALNARMRESDEIRIKYMAKQQSIANAWKKWKGQVMGIEAVDGVQIKRDREARYNSMAASNADWQEKYGSVIAALNALVASGKTDELAYSGLWEFYYYGPEWLRFSENVEKKIEALKSDPDSLKSALTQMAENFYKDYDLEVNSEIYGALRAVLLEKVNPEVIPEELKNDAYLQSILKSSAFTSKEAFMSMVSKGKWEKLQKDPVIALQHAINKRISRMGGELYAAMVRSYTEMNGLLALYIDGLHDMFPDGRYWPDANSTLRIAYGKLEGSAPHDGMAYTHYTTIDGVIAKYIPGNYEYDLPKKYLELYESKDFGRYTQDGELWVAFTGSNHTTGGNSGSPVLDENGWLIGLNFDRSWESTMSDIIFDTARCRNISLDLRYVLWTLEKLGGAKWLVDEMTLVDESNVEQKLKEDGLQRAEYMGMAITEDPSNPENYLNRGQVFAQLGMLEEAESDFREAVELVPEDEESHLALAEVLMHQDPKNEEVMTVLKDFNSQVAVAMRAQSLLNRGKAAEAYKHLAENVKPGVIFSPALQRTWVQAALTSSQQVEFCKEYGDRITLEELQELTCGE